MPRIYDMPIAVGAQSIDVLGHVNNREYLRWMEEAALEHTAAQGWPTERYLQLGCAWVAAEHRIQYLRPVFEGELLTLHTWVETMDGASSLRRYALMRGGKLVARGETRWAFVDLSRGRAIDVPQEVAEAFTLVAEGDPELQARAVPRLRRDLTH